MTLTHTSQPNAARFKYILLALVAVMIAACGGNTTAPTPTAGVELAQTFTSADGSILLQYPTGWVASDLMGQVTVANTQAAIDATVPAPGQFQMRVFATPLSAVQGLPADATPLQVIEFFATSLSSDAITFNPPTELTIGTRQAARIEGSGTDGQAVVIVVDMGEGVSAFTTATAAPGELPQHEPTLRAILESLVYTPPSGEPEAVP